ncbi:MAG: adenylate/guanylate cyclase domain-containing protein [Alphaproteobacteria bacterium]|nr:adenylate/guanylate cyclase domain-containing protein [Alphaproteobacteria bacterium]
MNPAAAADAARAWLLDEGARVRFLEDVFAGVCRTLREGGLPLERATLHSRALHPQFRAVRFLWEPGFARAELARVGPRVLTDRAYLDSPVRALFEGAEGLRQRLDIARDEPDAYPIYADLRREGYTDYAALPLVFSNGQRIASSWSTRRPGGWTTDELVAIDQVRPLLATAAEIRILRRTGRNIAETYLGRRAGARVLDGSIHRGDIERIDAVVGYLDMRGFTRFMERHPQDAVIARLNRFFDVFGEPVEALDGEILKFMGDAMLTVFPVDHDLADASVRAVDAAVAGFRGLAVVNAELERAGEAPIACGFGLHHGEVSYGNIGTATRLDFTVVGAAVNVAARLQQLSRDLGEPVVLSAEVAGAAGREVRSLGRHQLRGLAATREVFAPADLAQRRAPA